MARSTTGTLRAVKIVRRAFFDTARPYEREFAGLLHFEPLSRRHESLVDILQVGRSPDNEYFYCVMELADDARSPAPGCDSSASSFEPLTLDTLIRQHGGRLTVPASTAIARKVAEGLHFLHEARLAHGDVKPSNIIFVGSEPKLADVGLVARTDSTRSCVETRGYVPPEGPGSPQADIYSLGKCLYEMAMGQDRQAFPSPPAQLAEMSDRVDLLELNDVITKACEPEVGERYRTAGLMADDLRWLESGQSLRKRMRRRKAMRWAVVTGVILISLAAILLAHLRPKL